MSTCEYERVCPGGAGGEYDVCLVPDGEGGGVRVPVSMRGCVLEVQEENMMSAWCLMVKVEEQSAGRDSCRVQTSLSKIKFIV